MYVNILTIKKEGVNMTKNYYNYFDYLLKGELNTIEELSPYLIKLEANGLHTLKDVSNKTLK